jgi:hypothetical protein
MKSIHIPKNKSITFNEYLYNIINIPTSSFETDWGFFISIDDQPIQNNYLSKKNQEVIRKINVNSFTSIDEISDTIFDMDLTENYSNSNIKTIVNEANIYNKIKSNIYFVSSIIYYGGIYCIKNVITS